MSLVHFECTRCGNRFERDMPDDWLNIPVPADWAGTVEVDRCAECKQPDLVIIRCKRCGSQLGTLDFLPDDWSGTLPVSRCRKCVIPKPRRLTHVIRKHRQPFALGMIIPLAELRRAALKAQREGRAVSVDIPPIARPRW